MALTVNLVAPTEKYSKGVLVQAKRVGPEGILAVTQLSKLNLQCKKMLAISPVSFVFDCPPDGMRVGSASRIAGTSNRRLYSVRAWSPSRFFRDVSRRLKIPSKAFQQLVAAKLQTKPERKSAYLFDADAVERFWDEFNYDTALAQHKHVTPASVRETLALIGVRPVATINMQKAVTSAVYRMADLEPNPTKTVRLRL